MEWTIQIMPVAWIIKDLTEKLGEKTQIVNSK